MAMSKFGNGYRAHLLIVLFWTALGCYQKADVFVHENELNKVAGKDAMKYPETRRVDQVDEYFGVKVPDPYRWLEGDVRESEEVAKWVKDQNAVARKFLDAIPQRPEIERR